MLSTRVRWNRWLNTINKPSVNACLQQVLQLICFKSFNCFLASSFYDRTLWVGIFCHALLSHKELWFKLANLLINVTVHGVLSLKKFRVSQDFREDWFCVRLFHLVELGLCFSSILWFFFIFTHRPPWILYRGRCCQLLRNTLKFLKFFTIFFADFVNILILFVLQAIIFIPIEIPTHCRLDQKEQEKVLDWI